MTVADRVLFVGRHDELAIMRGALASASAGQGRIVLLVGEPGIGKTRLAGYFENLAAESGWMVLTGRCYEGSGAPAYWPWTKALEQWARGSEDDERAQALGDDAAGMATLVPELSRSIRGMVPEPASEADDQAQFRLFAAVGRVLARIAGRRPTAIVLDDIHCADSSSLRLLQFVGREIGTVRLAIVATMRTMALAPGHPLTDTLGNLVRERVIDRIELQGLDATDVAELMSRLTGTNASPQTAASVHELTEGNPLYVVEVVRALAARCGSNGTPYDAALEVPPTVRMAIARRIGALSPLAREVLTQAALFGRDFGADVLARATDLPPEVVLSQVDEAAAERVVMPVPGRARCYRFAHALFFETIVDALSESQRVSLNRAAARALAESGGEPAEIAHHWMAAGPAGDPVAAVAWARRAGEDAMRVHAAEEAVGWYRQALVAFGWSRDGRAEERAELSLHLGEALHRSGRREEAKATFEGALAVGRSLGSPELMTRAALGYAPRLSYTEHPWPDPAVIAVLEEAIASWGGRPASLHAQALARLGSASLFGEAVARDAALAAAEEMARRLGDDVGLRQALLARVMSVAQRREPPRLLDLSTELLRLADRAQDFEAVAVARLWRGIHLMALGDVTNGRAQFAALSKLSDEIGTPVWRYFTRLVAAAQLIFTGDFAAAEAASRDAFELGQTALPYAAWVCFFGQMMVIRLLQGRDDEWAAQYRAVAELHPDPAGLSLPLWVSVEAGDVDDVRAIFERLAMDDFAVARGSIQWATAFALLAEACALLEDAERAPNLYEALRSWERWWPFVGEGVVLGPVAHALGLLARTMERHADALGHFERAIVETRRVCARPFLARALFEQAVVLRRRDRPGDVRRAAALLQEARGLATDLGMAGLERRIVELDAYSPLAPPVRPLSGEDNVFRREGDYWTIAYADRTVRVRDGRGFKYLAELLHHPGQDIPATLLASTGNGHGRNVARDPDTVMAKDLGDAGPQIDARAATEYRRRVAELEAELEDAERRNDPGARDRARIEIEMISDELEAMHRDRRAASHAERARLNVTKGIKAALAKLEVAHPALADHLSATIRRGYLCVYRPDPRRPIVWR